MDENNKPQVPEEFTKVIKDFINDIKNTFPEYESLINKWWKDDDLKNIFDFCQKKLPPRFFDILYQNEDIFKEDSEFDTEFLPQIHFKNLWQYDITQKTRETIWKYLQLILFSIIGTVNNKDAFGDTAKLFEAINEDDFKSKLEETLSQMQNLFDNSNSNANFNSAESTFSMNMSDMPNAADIHDHITGILNGKLGKLAKEIAEETAGDLNLDAENVTDIKDVFNNLIKNPTKLMGLVKTVGDKIDTKIKSGELKESELIGEATELMNKMKSMPGMGNIQSMLNKLGLNNLGGKVNTNKMEAQLNKNMKMAKLKERLQAKAEANNKAKMEKTKEDTTSTNENIKHPIVSEEELLRIFNCEEKIEKTPRTKTEQPNKIDKKKKLKKS